MSEKAERLIQEFNQLAGNRTNWDSHWTEIAQRIWPSHSQLFQSLGMSRTEGEKRTEFVFDSTAATALSRFGAILDSLLTPRNQTWHRILPSNPDLMKDRQTKLWFEEANRILFRYRYAPEANFAAQNQGVYKSIGAYGTGVMFTDDLASAPGLRYRNCHLSEIYLRENHQGLIDAVFRKFPLTARQVLQKWKKKAPPKALERAEQAMRKNPDQPFFFLHVVEPQEDYIPGRIDFRGMPFSSCYVMLDTKAEMETGGYTSFPYAVARYEQTDGEPYGRGPAMNVLPSIKTLNEQKKTLLKQGHRAVDPVLLAHDDGVLDSFSLRPGAINYGGVDSQGRPLVHVLPTGRVDIGKDMMDDERMSIKDEFLVNIFQILVETPTMTATEVLERAREKGMLLAPTIGRVQSEYHGPLITRELDCLSRQGLLPPQPEALREARGEFRIEYDSPLSRTQRAEEAAGLMRTVETALNVVNITQNPEPLDHFNWDVIIPEIAEIQGVPHRWMQDPRIVAQRRQARAEASREQAEIQAAPGAAALIKSAAVAGRGGRS